MKKWLLPLLCVLPLVGIGLWFLLGKNLSSVLTAGLILACPLSHIFLMKHGGSDHHHQTPAKKPIGKDAER